MHKTQDQVMDKFSKLKLSLRYYLQGAADRDRRYLNTLKAMDFAMKTHKGLRKDGFTPEFQHQLETTQYLRTMHKLMENPTKTLSVMLLHDTMEDYNVSYEFLHEEFGAKVANGVKLMSKIRDGVRVSDQDYFDEMLSCPMATICKGADRIHNQNSMVGVFTKEKQIKYIEETEKFILPMLKKARRRHVHQEAVYENLKFVLTSQVQMVKAIHAAS